MNGEREKEIRDNAVGSRHSRGSWSEDAILDLLAALDAERERAANWVCEGCDDMETNARRFYDEKVAAEVRASSWEEAAGQLADALERIVAALASFRAKKDNG